MPTISLNVPEHINDLIRTVSKNRGEDKSTFVRRAIYKELGSLSFLTSEEKKSLGIITKKNECAYNLGKKPSVQETRQVKDVDT